VFVVNGAAVSWQSRLQPTVATSTTEAEYMAAASMAREAVWLRKALMDLAALPLGPTRLKGDNQGAIILVKNAIVSARSKHIDVQHHFVRERVAMGELVVDYIPTAAMVADCLTKALAGPKFVMCRDSMGLR
jgi:hypothetical protein